MKKTSVTGPVGHSVTEVFIFLSFWSAVTYSPTPSRVQYHQRGQA